jgi:hypothetical protein
LILQTKHPILNQLLHDRQKHINDPFFSKKIVLIKAGQDGAILQADKLRRLTIPRTSKITEFTPTAAEIKSHQNLNMIY